MRRSYASVAKEDIMSSTLPTSLHHGHSTVFVDVHCEKRDDGQEELASPTLNGSNASPIDICLPSNSILAKTSKGKMQDSLPSSNQLLKSLSVSCSPPFSTITLHDHLLMQPANPTSSNQNYSLNINNASNSGIGPGSFDKRIVLYKTEMCRTFEETGLCRYGTKCQFAHDRCELRQVARHPRYKTEICKTYWQLGTCPYGKRCCFIHNESEVSNVHHGLDGQSALSDVVAQMTLPRMLCTSSAALELNHRYQQSQSSAVEEVDMESMMGHLPMDMLSML